ncbi:hypothetical protein LXA43DRAFT_55802 [Ganoderma leucocontextum]|nr:hypothetical protein LXA43DRAFT_55802 [Ganoderma leucocontextum]
MESFWSGPASNHIEPIPPPGLSSDTPRLPPRSHIPQALPEDVGDLPQYPPSGMQTPNSQRFVAGQDHDESCISTLPVVISLPLAACATLALSVPTYVTSSLGTNTWGTRAIEYAIGTGCTGTVASLLLLVERHCFPDNLLEWKRAAAEWYGRSDRVELGILLAYSAALFSGVPGLGYSIRSLSEGFSAEGGAVLIQAFWGVVPALFVVMLTIRWLGPRAGEFIAYDV